jgi:hypothetical protein
MSKHVDHQTKMRIANTAASSMASVDSYLEGKLKRQATHIHITGALRKLHMQHLITPWVSPVIPESQAMSHLPGSKA